MLELNEYMDGRFQSIISGFNMKKKKKRNYKFDDEDFFDMEIAKTRPQTCLTRSRPHTRG